MISSPALQLSSPVATPGAVPPGDSADAVEGKDFAVLLAQSSVPAAKPDVSQANFAEVSPALSPTVSTAAEPAMPGAQPAAIPAMPGKILPTELPLAAAPNAPDLETDNTDPAPVTMQHDQRALTHQLPLSAQAGKGRAATLRNQASEKEPTKNAELHSASPEAAVEPAQALALTHVPTLREDIQQAVPALSALPQAAIPAIPATPTEASAAADPMLARTMPFVSPKPTARSLTDQAQPQAAADPQSAYRQTQAAQLTAPVAAPTPPPLTEVRIDVPQPAADPQRASGQTQAARLTASAAAPTPPLLAELQFDVPLPDALRATRFETARAAPLLATVGEELDVPVNAGAAPGPAVSYPTLFTAAAPAPQDRPHDFSALIDRLAAAREAASPQSVSISLPHADFGRVQIHFRNDDGALAVSLASSDPDFARIASQSAPPVLAVGDTRSAEHSPGQSSARSDGQTASASQQGSQRGQQDERRGERQARLDHQPRSASPERGRDRDGIFA